MDRNMYVCILLSGVEFGSNERLSAALFPVLGCCYDNPVMERFFGSLRHDWIKFDGFADINEARLSVFRYGVFRYIETFYNTKRIHLTLASRV